jgi:hypothetical protein
MIWCIALFIPEVCASNRALASVEGFCLVRHNYSDWRAFNKYGPGGGEPRAVHTVCRAPGLGRDSYSIHHHFGGILDRIGLSASCPVYPRSRPLGRTSRLDSFVPRHEVAALQPAAREQEPRGRQPVESTAVAGWQGQHDQLMCSRRPTHDQKQQGSSAGRHPDAASHIDPAHNAMTKVVLTISANQFA